MEGRHCFGHLTIEENLLTGAYTRRDGAGAIKADLEMVYNYFPACGSGGAARRATPPAANSRCALLAGP